MRDTALCSKECEEASADQAAKIAELTDQVSALTTQVAELLARLGTDSTNSSMPPSQDGPGAKPRSLRGSTGRNPGGQPGRKGKTLQMVAEPDYVEEHRPDDCAGCGRHLPNRSHVVGVERRQVFDLPEELALEVTEHQLLEVECPACHAITKGVGSVDIKRQVQYGPHVSAFCVYLITGQHIALERAAKLVSEWFGQPISPATINNMVNNAAAVITEEFKPVAEKLLLSAKYNHVDETGFKIAGKTRWVHSISNPIVTWIEPRDKRGREAMDDIGILPKYGGILIHDAWRSYDTYDALSAHQLCCSHLLRELNAVMDTHNHPPGKWCWAQQASDALKAIIHDPSTAREQRHIIISALLCAESDDPDSVGKLGQKQAALRNRINARLDDYLRFVNTGLPPTNNPAEQEIRMVKIKQKIAGCMRTMAGAQAFTTIRSYLSTVCKNGIQLSSALSSLFSGETWLPAIP